MRSPVRQKLYSVRFWRTAPVSGSILARKMFPPPFFHPSIAGKAAATVGCIMHISGVTSLFDDVVCRNSGWIKKGFGQGVKIRSSIIVENWGIGSKMYMVIINFPSQIACCEGSEKICWM